MTLKEVKHSVERGRGETLVEIGFCKNADSFPKEGQKKVFASWSGEPKEKQGPLGGVASEGAPLTKVQGKTSGFRETAGR